METRHMDTETYARHLAWERWLLQAMRDIELARSCDRAKRGVVLVKGKEVKLPKVDDDPLYWVYYRNHISCEGMPWNELVPMVRQEGGDYRCTGTRRDKLAAEDDQ